MSNATGQEANTSLYHLHCLQVAEHYLKSHGATAAAISEVGQHVSVIQDSLVQQYHLERIEDIDQVFGKFNDTCEQAMISLIDARKHARTDADPRRSSMSSCSSHSMTTMEDATVSSIVTMSNGDSLTHEGCDDTLADDRSKDKTNLSVSLNENSVLGLAFKRLSDGNDSSDLDLNDKSEDAPVIQSEKCIRTPSDDKLAKPQVSQSQLSIFDDICSDLFKELRATSSTSNKIVAKRPEVPNTSQSLPDSADANVTLMPSPTPRPAPEKRTNILTQIAHDLAAVNDHCNSVAIPHQEAVISSVQTEEPPIQKPKEASAKPLETFPTCTSNIGKLIDFGDDEPSDSRKQETQSASESSADDLKPSKDCKALVVSSRSIDLAVVKSPRAALTVVAQTKPQTLRDWRYGRGDIEKVPISVFWNYALEVEDDMEENGIEIDDTQLMVVI